MLQSSCKSAGTAAVMEASISDFSIVRMITKHQVLGFSLWLKTAGGLTLLRGGSALWEHPPRQDRGRSGKAKAGRGIEGSGSPETCC